MLQSHASPFAGRWYPAERDRLSDLIHRSLNHSAARRGNYVRGNGFAFVVPHAAPEYSGIVAAAAYHHIAALAPQRVVLLGFSHRHGIPGIGVPAVDVITTPLGATRIDRDAASLISGGPPFHEVPEEAACDHSVEIQLPFLQTVAPGAQVLPLYIGHLSRTERFAAASRLRELTGNGTVFVASSDFTHYGREFGYMPFALDHSTPSRLKALDAEMISSAGALDPSLFIEELHRAHSTVCGSEPIALLLEILRGLPGQEIFQETLDYQTSGEITSDYSHCVSYAALGYFPEQAFELSAISRQRLVQTARASLDRLQDQAEATDRDVRPDEPELNQHRSVFVTLYQHGELRGCIGCCRDPEILPEAVSHLTVSAARDDRRFEALDASEPTDIEISVLSPFKRIQSKADLIAGHHGGFLECGDHAGLLLPKVASERGWNTSKFLEALAMKASLSPRVYDDAKARLSVFSAQVFGDGARSRIAAPEHAP